MEMMGVDHMVSSMGYPPPPLLPCHTSTDTRTSVNVDIVNKVFEVPADANPNKRSTLTRLSRHPRAQKRSTVSKSAEQTTHKTWKEAFRSFILGQQFDMICACVIVANTVLVALETQYLTEHKNTSTFYKMAEVSMDGWYIVEVVLRIFAERWGFFTGPNTRFNVFDCVLASICMTELINQFVNTSKVKIGSMLRAVRLFRAVRAIRIVRLLRYIREFRKMVFALASSVQTLGWSVIMIFFMLYTYGIWFTSSVSDLLHDAEASGAHVPSKDTLKQHFGGVVETLYTLFCSISGGRSWYEYMLPLQANSSILVCLFLSFIILAIFGVLNIVTSVFVDCAMQSTQKYRELMVQEKLRDKEMYVQHIEQIFKQIDEDCSGSIGFEEIESFLNDKRLELQEYFEALDVNASDARSLFQLLDEDGSGSINMKEFCEGCMRLKGEARSFDINCMIYECKRNFKRMDKFMDSCENWFRKITAQNKVIRGRLPSRSLKGKPVPRQGPVYL